MNDKEFIFDKEEFWENVEKTINSAERTPVSYTHLDVYKRQLQG